MPPIAMTPNQVCHEIVQLFETRGAGAYYGEAVTQLQHGLQSAHAASGAGADEEEMLAALLHDIGHIVDENGLAELGSLDHDRIASEWLKERGFSKRLIELAAGHVAAKRYLVTTNPAYYDRLSPVSRETFVQQGGKMTAEEVAAFEKNPLRNGMLRLRSWDEAGKDPDAVVPGLAHWVPLIERHLTAQL